MQRLFSYLDNLTSDLGNDSTSAVPNCNQFYSSNRNKDSEDISQAFLLQTIKVLIRQSSKQILKVRVFKHFWCC